MPIYKAIAKVYLAQKKEDEALEALETALQLQLTYGAADDVQIAEISREMGLSSLLPPLICLSMFFDILCLVTPYAILFYVISMSYLRPQKLRLIFRFRTWVEF